MPTARPSFSLYTREKNPSGAWRYHRVREGRGQKTGELTGPFFARPFLKGKQVWKTLSATTFKEAKLEAEDLAVAIDAESRGLTIAEAEALTNSNRLPLKSAIDTYLEQKSNKAEKTVSQYRLTLNEFLEIVKTFRVHFMDEVTERVLRSYKKSMEGQGYAGKTISTRLNIVYFLLKKNGITVRLPKDEMPTIEEEAAVPYTEEELEKLFAAMTPEEFVRYKFFLGTGCRDKEVTFAAWQDIDWTKSEYHVRKKLDVGFTPKSHESRTVPLPKILLKLLKERHKTAADGRWVFVNDDGRPDNHFLRKLKRIAKRAGLNCRHCKTTLTKGKYDKARRVEVTCATDPVCQHFILHRFRKTCATRWLGKGIPVRTIQAWLGHKSLETTMIYLGVVDSNELRGQVDAAYGD